MDDVAAQYEAFPYPDRNPADEARRLVAGSPSDPLEMDHFLWAGARDWTRPLRVLVAGGGTGDGLIQLAQKLAWARRPARITYLDLSRSARQVAEARAAARGLDGIEFRTGSLLEAPELGPFDYIDCCGVLHHLDDPQAGLGALAAALADGGGLGFMVYAPYGRSGVYPLQEAFGALFGHLPPADKLAAAKALWDKVPGSHVFKLNPHLGDHRRSDAGFYDLLLHSRDRPFTAPDWIAALEAAGLRLAGFCRSALYDLGRLTEAGADLPEAQRMGIAEKLRGSIKVHVGYAATPGAAGPASGRSMQSVPHLTQDPGALAKGVARGLRLTVQAGSEKVGITLPREAAPLLAAVDGRRTLAEIQARSGADPMSFAALWSKVHAALEPWGLLLYSTLLRR